MRKFLRELRLTIASEVFKLSFTAIMRITPKPDGQYQDHDYRIYAQGFWMMGKAIIDGVEDIPPTTWKDTHA
jgi:hypothetical protein